MRGRGLVVLAGTVVFWASGVLAQGLYWESRTTGIGDGVHTSQFYAMPKMIKVMHTGGPTVLIRVDQDKFITIDPKTHSYREMSGSEMESLAQSSKARMQAAMAQMQQRMAKMPPEQRAAMEQAMRGLSAAETTATATTQVTNTGETRTIGGYACAKYVATADGKPVLTAWATKDIPGFATLRADWLAYQKRLGSQPGTPGGNMGQAFAKIDGFPMETEMGDIKTEVTKVEARTIPASEFEVPAGFKKESAPAPPAKH
jgi:hypothetical protein